MRYTGLASIALAVMSTAALAETRLETFERISEVSTNFMTQSMIDMAVEEGADRAALESVLVEFEWDDDFREAGACMLDAYDAEIGAGKTDEMLAAMEQLFTDAVEQDLSIDEMAEMSETVFPEGMDVSTSMGITQNCGMMGLQMDWMSETGFMDAMIGAASN